MENAKFKIGTDGIEITGPENFVVSQINNFKELIQGSYQNILTTTSSSSAGKYKIPDGTKKLIMHTDAQEIQTEEVDFIDIGKPPLLHYDNVFVVEGEKIIIICDVPGSTRSKKMINMVLIYLWAKLQQGKEIVSFFEIREAGIHYGDFDATNFSKYMDSNKKYFLILGDNKNKSVKLIRPGIREAEKLINELNNK